MPIDRPEAIEFRQGYTAGADLRRAGEGAFVLPLDASPAVALRAIAIAWLDPLPFDDPALRTDYAAALADRVATSQGVAVSPRFGRWVIAMTALASVSDADITATVLTSLEGGVTAYGGTDDTFVADVFDWRRFTDVYEVLGGIESTSDAMRLSADDDQRTELDPAPRRWRHTEHLRRVRRRGRCRRCSVMRWRRGASTMSQRSRRGLGLGRARDEMVEAAATAELEIGPHVQEHFETASTSMDPTRARYEAQREALDHVAEALRLDTGDRGCFRPSAWPVEMPTPNWRGCRTSGSRARSRKRQRRPTT